MKKVTSKLSATRTKAKKPAKAVTVKKTRKSILAASTPVRVESQQAIQKEQSHAGVGTAVLQQQRVEESKFYLGAPSHELFREEHFIFPERYNKDRLVLLARDPYWMHSYWEVTASIVEKAKKENGENVINSSRMVLRVKDITNAAPEKPNSFFDIDLAPGTRNWYINVQDQKTYCVEIGFKTPDGRFIMLLRSNYVSTPRAGVSDVMDEAWMSAEEYDKIYALSGGFGIGLSSGELKKRMKEKIQHWITSGVPGSMFSPWKKKEVPRNFFLWVEAELIIYGATMPDAGLTIQGTPKKLNPDGTFSARFAFPNGTQVIPVSATSSDKIDTITITPIANRETK